MSVSPAALRSQLEAAESRLEAERKAHQSTKVAAATREHELEARLAGGGSALSDMQRALEEAGSRERGETYELSGNVWDGYEGVRHMNRLHAITMSGESCKLLLKSLYSKIFQCYS